MFVVKELTKEEWQNELSLTQYGSIFYDYWWGSIIEKHFSFAYKPLLVIKDNKFKIQLWTKRWPKLLQHNLKFLLKFF